MIVRFVRRGFLSWLNGESGRRWWWAQRNKTKQKKVYRGHLGQEEPLTGRSRGEAPPQRIDDQDVQRGSGPAERDYSASTAPASA